MAYQVNCTLPARRVGRADVSFVVKQDGAVLGTLEVSRGAIVWYPKKASYGYKATWKQFNEIAKENFRGEECRTRS